MVLGLFGRRSESHPPPSPPYTNKPHSPASPSRISNNMNYKGYPPHNHTTTPTKAISSKHDSWNTSSIYDNELYQTFELSTYGDSAPFEQDGMDKNDDEDDFGSITSIQQLLFDCENSLNNRQGTSRTRRDTQSIEVQLDFDPCVSFDLGIPHSSTAHASNVGPIRSNSHAPFVEREQGGVLTHVLPTTPSSPMDIQSTPSSPPPQHLQRVDLTLPKTFETNPYNTYMSKKYNRDRIEMILDTLCPTERTFRSLSQDDRYQLQQEETLRMLQEEDSMVKSILNGEDDFSLYPCIVGDSPPRKKKNKKKAPVLAVTTTSTPTIDTKQNEVTESCTDSNTDSDTGEEKDEVAEITETTSDEKLKDEINHVAVDTKQDEVTINSTTTSTKSPRGVSDIFNPVIHPPTPTPTNKNKVTSIQFATHISKDFLPKQEQQQQRQRQQDQYQQHHHHHHHKQHRPTTAPTTLTNALETIDDHSCANHSANPTIMRLKNRLRQIEKEFRESQSQLPVVTIHD